MFGGGCIVRGIRSELPDRDRGTGELGHEKEGADMHTESKEGLGTPGGRPLCFRALFLLLAPVAASTGLAHDCDLNGREDALEIAANPGLDCNQNGVLDLCDAAASLGWLFPGNRPHVRGASCTLIPGCPPICGGR